MRDLPGHKRTIKIIVWLALAFYLGMIVGQRKAETKNDIPKFKTKVERRPTPTPTIYIRKSYLRGKASFYTNEYCEKYNPRCLTASGDRFDDSLLTLACSDRYSLGTNLKVSHEGKSVVAKCNDRGSFPEKYGRVADLSKATFAALAPLSKGVIEVEIEEENEIN